MRSPITTLVAVTAMALSANACTEINPFECNLAPWIDYFRIMMVESTVSRPAGFYFRCFANAGECTINQDGVIAFIAGNNAGKMTYEPYDGSKYEHTFAKGSSIEARQGSNWGFVDKVQIF